MAIHRYTSAGKITAKVMDRAVEIAEQLNAFGDTDPTTEQVMALFGHGDREVFVYMDEKPGDFPFASFRSPGTAYGWWHIHLRNARNDADGGPWPFQQ